MGFASLPIPNNTLDYEDEYFNNGTYYRNGTFVDDFDDVDPGIEAAFKNFQRFVITPLGMFGSIMIIVVLIQEKNRRLASSVYYIGLAISDFVLLLARQILLEIGHLPSWGPAVWTTVVSCTDISSWLLVCVAIERALCVTYPQNVRFICTALKAKVGVVGIVLFFFALNSFRVLACYQPYKCDYTFFFYLKEVEAYYDNWITFAIPSIIMMITSIMIVYQLKRRSIRSTASSRINSVTRTLLAVCIAFVVLMGPVRIYRTEVETIWFTLEAIQHMNPAVNFFLYGLTGSRFRGDFIQLYSFCKKPENIQTQRTLTVRSLRRSTIRRQ